MKKIILTLALVSFIGTSLVSCSTDDSGLQQETKADGFGGGVIPGPGDKELPKPPIRA
ncbi:hypothetical protein R1T16_07250 [Flavobacterium sp. DG1-102-2]|uniref:hypothetical protein n=1 Tax=Flavobacterium sp. DG1-102-2 TaxID=3081663 RepID=UPI0029499283|nr:hypothetical protein [Flavobacterium sp. DG1-102-2]MDV6168217.1 hypothetical protein [Flavobacterium sp. DG1-102-2]